MNKAPESIAVPGIARALRLVEFPGSPANKTESAIKPIIERNSRGIPKSQQ